MTDSDSSWRDWDDYQQVDWEIGAELKDPEQTVYRLAVYYDDPESWMEKFYDFLAEPALEEVAGFNLGLWSTEGRVHEPPHEALAALISARDQMTGLRAFRVGEMDREESELSWITLGDLGPLLAAYPQLELLYIHGSGGLSLGRLDLPELRSLTILTGGLSSQVVREILRGHLPKLEHLELYLGEPNYGGTVSLEDFSPLISGQLFPNLRFLGLKNSVFQDELAQVLAVSPFIGQLETLDLSEGTLSDAGAQALLDSPWIRQLRTLDLHHHWMSEEMVSKLRALPVEVDTGDGNDPSDDWRFVSFSE